jgi:hypothetical protein
MKKCSWCGAEYHELTLCAIDQRELIVWDGTFPVPERFPGIIAVLKSLRDEPTQVYRRKSLFLESFELFGRYIASLILGYLAAMACALIGFIFWEALYERIPRPMVQMVVFILFCIPFCFAGYCGILTATACLPRGTRALGSIALWVMATAWFWLAAFGSQYEEFGFPIQFEWIAAATIGGALAVLFFNLGRWPKFAAR